MNNLFVGSNGSRFDIDLDKMPASYSQKPVKIYDVEKKRLIKNCISVTEAGKYLGLRPAHVNDIIKFKRRNTSNKLGLTITCR